MTHVVIQDRGKGSPVLLSQTPEILNDTSMYLEANIISTATMSSELTCAFPSLPYSSSHMVTTPQSQAPIKMPHVCLRKWVRYHTCCTYILNTWILSGLCPLQSYTKGFVYPCQKSPLKLKLHGTALMELEIFINSPALAHTGRVSSSNTS